MTPGRRDQTVTGKGGWYKVVRKGPVCGPWALQRPADIKGSQGGGLHKTSLVNFL